jgi:predicted pyridoxine 5'-phosphate oxidase superfamily flavin-nucleotide-binding protein
MSHGMSRGGTPITSVAELEAIVGAPGDAVRRKTRHRLHDLDRVWLAASPLCFVAMADADGNADVSPKGDPPGFVHVLDDTTIAIPERPGNRRADGFHNVLANLLPGLPPLGDVGPGDVDARRLAGAARLLLRTELRGGPLPLIARRAPDRLDRGRDVVVVRGPVAHRNPQHVPAAPA